MLLQQARRSIDLVAFGNAVLGLSQRAFNMDLTCFYVLLHHIRWTSFIAQIPTGQVETGLCIKPLVSEKHLPDRINHYCLALAL